MAVFFSVLMGAMAIGQGSPNLGVIANGRVAAKKVHNLIDRVPSIDSSSPSGLKYHIFFLFFLSILCRMVKDLSTTYFIVDYVHSFWETPPKFRDSMLKKKF